MNNVSLPFFEAIIQRLRIIYMLIYFYERLMKENYGFKDSKEHEKYKKSVVYKHKQEIKEVLLMLDKDNRLELKNEQATRFSKIISDESNYMLDFFGDKRFKLSISYPTGEKGVVFTIWVFVTSLENITGMFIKQDEIIRDVSNEEQFYQKYHPMLKEMMMSFVRLVMNIKE
jgi:hypothetical protein